MAALIWDINGEPMERRIRLDNFYNVQKQNRQPEVTDHMDEDGYNGYTAYLFIGYYFLPWIYLDNRLQPLNSAHFNYC